MQHIYCKFLAEQFSSEKALNVPEVIFAYTYMVNRRVRSNWCIYPIFSENLKMKIMIQF